MSKKSSSDLLRLETESNYGFSQSLLLKPELANKRTFKVERSSVLSNVKAFLPRIAAANCDLQKKLESVPASAVDIENTSDCTGDVIEMNLSLIEHSDSDTDVSSESGCELQDSDSDVPSDSVPQDSSIVEESSIVETGGSLGQVTEKSLKIPQKANQKKPQIEVISDSKPESPGDEDILNDANNSPGET